MTVNYGTTFISIIHEVLLNMATKQVPRHTSQFAFIDIIAFME